MREIYIDELKIANFGPFFSEHVFDFKGSENKKVILVGGRNGAGKTHLLRAIYLAIVGQRGVPDLRTIETGSGATRFDLKESLNRLAKLKGYDKSELTITLRIQDKTGSIGKTITIYREIRHRPKSDPVFSSKVIEIEDGKPSKSYQDDSELISVIDNYLTRELLSFFFFDAERGQNIQLSDNNIIYAISRTLGLSTYEQLERDLRELSDKLKPETGQLSEKEKQKNAISATINNYEKDLETIKNQYREYSDEIEYSEIELEEIDGKLLSLGVVNPEKIEAAKRKEKELVESLGKLKQQLEYSWEKEIPLMVLGNYANSLYKYLVSEERRREWESRKEAVEPRIPQVKKDVFDVNIPPQFELDSNSRSFYEKRLQDALQRIFDPAPQGMSENIFVVPENNERSVKIRNLLSSKTSINIEDICADYEIKLVEKNKLGKEIISFQKDESTQKEGEFLLQKKGEIGAKIDHLKEKQSKNKENEEKISAKLPELRRNETNLENEIAQQKKQKDLADLAARYREVAHRIEKEAAEKLRNKISEIVGELWLDITDRNMEFKSLEFDENWKCFLVKYDDEKLDWDSINTSAGQKQVRLLAFTEALRRLAQKTPPLVVDTPLGRLDKEVKQNVLERLYMRGHQTLIFSTDAEIDPESPLFKMIEDRIARVYTLNTDGQPDDHSYRVRLSDDYFKRVL